MKCIIVEDESIAALAVESEIKKYGELEFVGTFNDPTEALDFLDSNEVDLIFLDVEMPKMNGLKFIEKTDSYAQIVLITSHKEFAIDAFENDVTDFIVKPFEPARFEQAVKKVKKIAEGITKAQAYASKLFVKTGTKLKPLKIDEILYIEALADYVKIQYEKERLTVLSTMKSILRQLPKDKFIRVHRSYIVNIEMIEEIEESTVVVGGKLFPVSRKFKKELKEKIHVI